MVAKMGPVRLRKATRRFLERRADSIGEATASCGVSRVSARRRSRSRIRGKRDRSSAELAAIREFGAEVITAQSPDYPRQLLEIHAPPIVLYVWGRTDGARSALHCCDRFCAARVTTARSAQRSSLPTPYSGLTVHRVARAGHRHGSTGAHWPRKVAPSLCSARAQQNSILQKTRLAEEGSAAETAQWFPNFRWRSSRIARPFRCATESSVAGATASCSRGRVEQRRAYHRLAGDRAGPVGLCRSGSYQCPDRPRFQPPHPARREARHGCGRHS